MFEQLSLAENSLAQIIEKKKTSPMRFVCFGAIKFSNLFYSVSKIRREFHEEKILGKKV